MTSSLSGLNPTALFDWKRGKCAGQASSGLFVYLMRPCLRCPCVELYVSVLPPVLDFLRRRCFRKWRFLSLSRAQMGDISPASCPFFLCWRSASCRRCRARWPVGLELSAGPGTRPPCFVPKGRQGQEHDIWLREGHKGFLVLAVERASSFLSSHVPRPSTGWM